MAVIRVEKTKNYTVMSNYHLKDKNLSLKAKGLLSYMLSLPDDWDYSVRGLVSCLKEGKDGIQAALHELEKYGYLKREQGRTANGKLSGAIYTVMEIPLTEKPHTGKPLAEKPPQLNTNGLNTDGISKEDDDDNKDWLETLKFYQNEINPVMGGWELERLGDLYDSFGSKWVVDAMKEAIERNARSLKYITAVLEQWQRDGYKVDKRKKKGNQPSKKKANYSQDDFDKARAEMERRLNNAGDSENLRASG
jgi:DnaD/phage-associated family protein